MIFIILFKVVVHNTISNSKSGIKTWGIFFAILNSLRRTVRIE